MYITRLTLSQFTEFQNSFRTLAWSCVKTTMMMIGDFDYDGLVTVHNFSGVNVSVVFTTGLLLIFCFLMQVLLMNLLVCIKLVCKCSISSRKMHEQRVENGLKGGRKLPPHSLHLLSISL